MPWKCTSTKRDTDRQGLLQIYKTFNRMLLSHLHFKYYFKGWRRGKGQGDNAMNSSSIKSLTIEICNVFTHNGDHKNFSNSDLNSIETLFFKIAITHIIIPKNQKLLR